MSQYLEKSKQYKGFHYSVLEPRMLSYLHNKTLEMLKIIIPIFDESNIRYMICGGTLLGALTSGQFIPWDDDVDICILEDDYEKAIEILISKVPSWMFVQWYSTEEKYFHGWVKVRDKNSHVYPDTASYMENGVWIDLYKLIMSQKRFVPYMITKEHLEYLNRRCEVGDISEDERDRRIRSNYLTERLAEQQKEYENSKDTEDIYIIWSASKILVDKQWVFPRKKYLFEGMELLSFNNAKQYLERHYGANYIDLPPYEMRRVGINHIDFTEV